MHKKKQLIWSLLMVMTTLLFVQMSYGQKVNLPKKRLHLEALFKLIRTQTGYEFLYNSDMLENLPAITVEARDLPVEKLLDKSLSGLPLTYTILDDKTIVIRRKPAAQKKGENKPMPVQKKQLSGRVLDDEGRPVDGASVFIIGTQQGTLTDENGQFNIAVPEGQGNDSLSVSFIGFVSRHLKIDFRSSAAMKIVLSPTVHEAASVMVSTGYQLINKDSYTGTAVIVSGEELKKVNPQSILQSLQVFDPSFKIAENNLVGSNPNSLPQINVRGSTAMPSGSEGSIISRNNLSGTVNLPTFILDGYEVDVQKIFDLDINRVKSITLLKDAAATAVYGSRAANGVVVITTVPPKAGKLSLSYDVNLNIATPDLSEYHVLNSQQKLAYEKMAGLYDPANNPGLYEDQLNDLYYHKKELVLSGVNTDWLSQPVRTAVGQKHTLFLEGGTSALRYGLSLRYQTSPGVMKGSSRDRYSTELNLAYNLGSKLLFRNNLSVTKMNGEDSPYGRFADYVRMNPYYPIRDSAGAILQSVDDWTRSYSNGGTYLSPVLNPMYDATLGGFSRSEYLEVIDAFSADWTMARGLRLRGQLSIQQIRTTGDHFTSPFSNAFYNYGADRLEERGQYDYNNQVATNLDGSLTLNFNRQIGLHFVNLVAGGNIRTTKADYKAFTAIGFSNDKFSDIGFASGYAEDATPYSDYQENRLIGLFTSLNYSYRDKYLMDFTFREDGSSTFGKDRRMAPFTALGLGWNMHKESFMEGSPFSRFKIRASTGLTGSVSFSPYMAQTTYSYYMNNWYSTGPGAIVNNYGNEDLQWQKTRNYDLGLELGFLQDRLQIMPRYYIKRTSGLIASVTLPPSTGFASYLDNIGDMENKGWELSFQYNVIRGKDFNWNLTTNLVHNENIIVKISDALKAYNNDVDEAQMDAANQGVPLLHYVEGQSLNTIYAVPSLGIDPESGREVYVKKDGTRTFDWDARDIRPVGIDQPKAEGYFGSSIRYKNFNLNFNFYTRWGGDHYNQTLVDRVENADPRYNVDSRVFADKWKAPGDHAFYKNIADLGQTQTVSRFVQKDNVLELQSLYLSYDLPKAHLLRSSIKSLRVAFTMNNLVRWSSISQERGIDYPFARSFNISLTGRF
ncbi:SusC/RagA family TonB-linked outer membrane protein [Arachidicoccus terrestris]|uniref:SusC/RagA family TonB-linked outer membrane protein n=1 Tax=Arachidicoccus terrestris TaxID=2875539 RepID=UPI001CC3C9C7|nr:SusC/RagA family TonB-linked outer membrane protein [Arachidicoccus terrestris]UAY56750.1 SusC/RagA family TonB-linked outer membrane protein [Arachidicoccus terrestris]